MSGELAIQGSPLRSMMPQPSMMPTTVTSGSPNFLVIDASKLAQERDDAVRENLSLKQENEVLRAHVKVEALQKDFQATIAREIKLTEEVSRLREENEALHLENQKLREKIQQLAARVDALERRDQAITIREIMRTLERHICLDIVGTIGFPLTILIFHPGSRTRAKNSFFNFAKLKADPTFNESLTKKGYPVDIVERLKDGNRATHDQRPTLTVDEFKEMTLDDDDDNNNAVQLLVTIMAQFKMVEHGNIVTASPWF